jgi:hypothetical protein
MATIMAEKIGNYFDLIDDVRLDVASAFLFDTISGLSLSGHSTPIHIFGSFFSSKLSSATAARKLAEECGSVRRFFPA